VREQQVVSKHLEYAQQAHLIRAINIPNQDIYKKWSAIIDRSSMAMQGKNRDSLVEIVRNHLPEFSRTHTFEPTLFDMEMAFQTYRDDWGRDWTKYETQRR